MDRFLLSSCLFELINFCQNTNIQTFNKFIDFILFLAHFFHFHVQRGQINKWRKKKNDLMKCEIWIEFFFPFFGSNSNKNQINSYFYIHFQFCCGCCWNSYLDGVSVCCIVCLFEEIHILNIFIVNLRIFVHESRRKIWNSLGCYRFQSNIK